MTLATLSPRAQQSPFQPRPVPKKNGRWLGLNQAIIEYYTHFKRFCRKLDQDDYILDEDEHAAGLILITAYRRIFEYRNADLTDLPLLETLHTIHESLGWPPVTRPHVDVSRRYEGPAQYDEIDRMISIEGKRQGLTNRQVRDSLRARGTPPGQDPLPFV